MANILITGGTGRLGRILAKLLPDALTPTHAELDITDRKACEAYALSLPQSVTVIHCAGFVDSAAAEVEREACWNANVEGTRNMARAFSPSRFVYLSSPYVFDGAKGNYSETDIPNPVNFYGLTKLCSEQAVQEYPNTLILRAGIRADPPWRFPNAFIDQWTSDDFMSVRAPEIIRAALSDCCGILHIGGHRRSVYELARTVSEVGQMTRAQFPGVKIPRDTSLNSGKWASIKA